MDNDSVRHERHVFARPDDECLACFFEDQPTVFELEGNALRREFDGPIFLEPLRQICDDALDMFDTPGNASGLYVALIGCRTFERVNLLRGNE